MYQFYLNGDLLPVTPEKMTIKIANQNKTLNLISGEEINLLKRPGLSKITFSALLPAVKYPFAQYQNGFQKPAYYLNKLESLKNGLKPFFFQVLRTEDAFQSNFTVSLEDYEIIEDAETYGRDVYIQVSLLQYRNYGTKIIKFKDNDTANIKNGDRDTTGKEEIEMYTVKSGDCLWNISKKYLGNGARYQELITLNLQTLDADAKKHGHESSANGYWLFPGTILKIPKE